MKEITKASNQIEMRNRDINDLTYEELLERVKFNRSRRKGPSLSERMEREDAIMTEIRKAERLSPETYSLQFTI